MIKLIRKATILDKEAIGKILCECYNIEDTEEGIEVFEAELSKGYHYLVSVEEEKVVGVVTWYIHGIAKHGLCELDRIAVTKDFRGKGAAKELFEGLIDDAKEWYEKKGSKLRKLYLLTHDDNSRAHAFYEKLGMEHEITLKEHYYKAKDERVYSIFFD